MKKKIISILCALVMTIASAEPIFASDALYTQFKNASISGIKKLFTDNISSFGIDASKYNESQKSLIILKAWQDGFSSFSELNQNVINAAQDLTTKENNPTLMKLSGYSKVELDFTSPSVTDSKDVFEIDDKEFIILDKAVDDDGEDIFFVMAKDYYGTVAADADNFGRWDDNNSRLLGYKLTNQMAFGNYTTYNLPSGILEHLDILHEWNVEPGSGSGYTTESTVIGPISVISATEYKKYGAKIGLDGAPSYYWTRTPVLNSSEYHFTVNPAAPTVFNKNKGWGGNYLRPVFYLKSSFFKQEELQKCGENVAAYLDEILTESDLSKLYSENEMKTVFGGLTVTPKNISGDAVVGQTLTTDYTYNGSIPLIDVKITWEKSLDKVSWEIIPEASGKSYVLKNTDAGYFVRAAFLPTFNSVIFKNGEKSYAQSNNAVYTDQSIINAVSEIDRANDIATLRARLEEHESLFHLDYSVAKFPDSAAQIFMKDNVRSVSEVIALYNKAIALDEFAKADNSNAKEKAESEHLLGGIPEYKKLITDEQKNSVILNLFWLDSEKEKVSAFLQKAEELIMLERFSSAERGDIVSLLSEYASKLGVYITDLTTYQLEVAGAYVAGTDYGTDLQKLKSAVELGITNARKVASSGPVYEGETEDYSYITGFLPPNLEKPEPSGQEVQSLFSDLATVPWGMAAINNLAQKGILAGNGDGTFSPDRLVTRNEFVKMIVNAFDIPMSDSELQYEDIDKNSWSAEYIMAALEAGIISGIDETRFGNGMNITRQDVAVIADRVMTYKGIELKSSSLRFDDSNEIADYAVTAVAKMNYCGIMNGLSEKSFAPKGSTTRAMAAVVVYNLINYYEAKMKADDEESEEFVMNSPNDKYDLVFELGILTDDIVADNKITRGELAAALTVLGKYDHHKGENIFEDVLQNHPYYKEITAVYNNNIMAGKTEKLFMPDEVVTYEEAYNAIIALSGYTNFDWAKEEADKALNKEPIFARKTDELTGDIAKRLFFAALEIPVLDLYSGISLKVSEKNILNLNFDVYREVGIVNAVSGMSIGGRGEFKDDEIIITVDSKDFFYSGNDYDYSDYLGCKVIYYYTEIDDAYKIVNMTLSKSVETPLRFSFEEIVTAEKNLSSITYEKGKKTKEAKISKSADFIYNGKRSYAIALEDLTPNNGYITLIDTDNDKEYDVVKIDNYEYIMVAQIDIKGNSILDKFTWKTFGFNEDEDAEKISITKNGRYIKLDYLSQGDVLAIAKSRDGKLMNAYVSDKKVTGRVTDISADDYEIQIDNNVLKCVRDFNFDGLSSDMTVTVGLDWNGYAVGYYTEMSDIDTKFGYLYKMNEEEELDTIVFNILTQDNEYVVLNSDENILLNNRRAEKHEIYSSLSHNQSTGTMKPQLIAYGLNDEGKIKKIYTADEQNGIETSQNVPLVLNKKFGDGGDTAPGVIYNSFGMTLDFEYNLLNSGVMFNITIEGGVFDKENSYVTNVGSKVIAQSSNPEKFYIYNSDTSRVSRLCVYEHITQGGNDGYNESFNTQAFVVSKAFEKLDDKKGEVVTAYKGYHSGKEVEYSFSEKLKKDVDASKIKPGDVLLIWLSGTEITRFRRLYTNKESDAYTGETDLLCNYGDHIYTGGDIVRGGTNWDYAYDWAQHIIERAEGKSGSTSASSSRWTSLYGDIELIYKSEIYSYPVIRLKVAGKSEALSYTLDANSKLYEFNKTTKTIRTLDNENLNVSLKKAVVTVRYGNVRDVIIYEE